MAIDESVTSTATRPVRGRRREVPIWVTVVAVLLGLFATALGVAAMIDPRLALGYVPGAEDLAALWGGRNAGLGVILLVAVALRSAAGYVVAFAGQVVREIADLIGAFPNIGGLVTTGVFLAVDVVALVFCVRALRARRRAEATAT